MKTGMLIMHFIGLALVLGTAFSLFFAARKAGKLGGAEGTNFHLNSASQVMWGNIGLVLSFLSGGYLMTPWWKLLGTMPLLATKLALFLVVGAFFGMIGANAKKARKADAGVYLKKVTLFSNLALLTALTMVVLAVLVFQ